MKSGPAIEERRGMPILHKATWSLNLVQLFERPSSPQMSISSVMVAQRTTLPYILSLSASILATRT